MFYLAACRRQTGLYLWNDCCSICLSGDIAAEMTTSIYCLFKRPPFKSSCDIYPTISLCNETVALGNNNWLFPRRVDKIYFVYIYCSFDVVVIEINLCLHFSSYYVMFIGRSTLYLHFFYGYQPSISCSLGFFDVYIQIQIQSLWMWLFWVGTGFSTLLKKTCPQILLCSSLL